jgi:hypothetical protein
MSDLEGKQDVDKRRSDVRRDHDRISSSFLKKFRKSKVKILK